MSARPAAAATMFVTERELLAKARQLPSLSAAVTALLASMERENVDTATLVGMIARDPGLTMRVLRVANSAFYGLSSHVGAIGEAVVVIGFHAVRSLALAAAVVDMFPQTDAVKFDRLALWRHAIGTGVAAKVIAARLGRNPETAFTAGLLHDIGKFVLYAHFPDIFNAVLARRAHDRSTMMEAERALLGFDHSGIAYEVARRWRLPPPIQQALRDHHRPDAEPAFLTDLVHVANIMSLVLDIGDGGDYGVPPLSMWSWERLGLDCEIFAACLDEVGSLNAGMSLIVAD